MKIELKSKKLVTLQSIPSGTVFMFNGILWSKADSSDLPNYSSTDGTTVCFRLHDGTLKHLGNVAQVEELPDAKLVV